MNRQSSNNNRRARWRWLLRWKRALNHYYKNDNGRNFQFTKFSFSGFVLTDRRSLSGKRPKSASGKSSSCRFSFSAARNANTKATEYVIFGFSFCILVFPLLEKFEPHCLSAIRIFQCFNRHNLWKFRQPTLYWESWRLCRSFINLTEWRQSRVTLSSWLTISTHVKNTIFFHLCCYGFSQSRKPIITPRLMW